MVNPFIQKTFCLGMGLMLTLGSGGLPACADSFAPLPQVLQAHVPAKTQVVMVTFYATWCGACKRMRPFEAAMVKEAGNKLKAFWVDVDQPKQAELVRRYGINGTPTYFLFDAKGKPLFTMNRYLSAPVLQAEVNRFTGKLKTLPMLDIPTEGKPLVLVVPDTKDADLLLANLGPSALPKVEARRDSVRHPLLGKSRALLIDRQGRELYRASADTNPATTADYLELLVGGEP